MLLSATYTGHVLKFSPFLRLDINQVDLGIYAIHVVAGVLKLFFRTLPSPLITADVYDEFLRACGEYSTLFQAPRSLYVVVRLTVLVKLNDNSRRNKHIQKEINV